jgi:hypothetical protein
MDHRTLLCYGEALLAAGAHLPLACGIAPVQRKAGGDEYLSTSIKHQDPGTTHLQ